MVDFNTSLYMPQNISIDNNAGQSSSVGKLKTIPQEEYTPHAFQEFKSDFTSEFYGDGPYSLEHPNNTTEFLAQNVDYLA